MRNVKTGTDLLKSENTGKVSVWEKKLEWSITKRKNEDARKKNKNKNKNKKKSKTKNGEDEETERASISPYSKLIGGLEIWQQKKLLVKLHEKHRWRGKQWTRHQGNLRYENSSTTLRSKMNPTKLLADPNFENCY